MIGLAFLLQQQGPVGHYAGGASSKIAGTTAFAGKMARFLLSSVPQWVQIAGVLVGVPVAIIVVWQLWKHRRAIWGWWLARRSVVRLAIIAAVFVVAAGAATSGLVTYNYIMHDNDFCQSCHIMDTAWNRFQVSAHKDLQCHACHRQPLYVSSVELFYWVGERQMEVPVHDKVPTAVCDECHMQKRTDSTLTNVALTAGHAVHLKSDSAALKDVQCVTCHGRDFHVFAPSNETCSQSGCHKVMKVNLGAMSRQAFRHCTLCHDFKSRVPLSVTLAEAKKTLYPQAVNCESCHAMAQKLLAFDLAADPHKGNCGICHNPHKQTEPKDAFKTCAESQCHGSPDTLTAFHRGLGAHAMQNCGECHVAHTWKVKGTDCLSCHKSINLDRPLRRVGLVLRPASYGRRPVRRSRHARSAFRFASFSRPSRAVQRASLPVPPTPTQQQPDTTFRHSRHVSVTCTTCHGTTTTHGGLTFERPAGCWGCHHGPQQRATCTVCHAAETLGGRPAAAVERASPFAPAAQQKQQPDTTFRHSLHTSVACTTCHGVTTTHGGLKFERPAGCLGCHHGEQQRATCTACHATETLGAYPEPMTFAITARPTVVTRTQMFEHARHSRVTCTACHGADAKRTVIATCANCHSIHHTATANCTGCHPPSATVGFAAHDRAVHAGCARCHTDPVVAALPAARAECLVCHAAQREHFPNGDCATCHVLDHDMMRAGRVSAGTGAGR